MNTKFFVSALFAGLMIAANTNARYGGEQSHTTMAPEETVETAKGEKLTGHWRGKYFVTDSGRALHVDLIKKEHQHGMAKNKKRSTKQVAEETAKTKMVVKKKRGKMMGAQAPEAEESEMAAE